MLASAWVIAAAAIPALAGGNLFLASTSSSGQKGQLLHLAPSISADGRVVAFDSTSENLHPDDHDPNHDIFVKDLLTGELLLASSSDAGESANSNAFGASISADGTKVAFFTNSDNLDPADTDTESDVYVKDLVTGDLTLASTSSGGTKGNADSKYPDLSAAGTQVAFDSFASNLAGADDDSVLDVYVKDLATGTLTLVSRKQNGAKGNRDSFQPSIVADGTLVAFSSRATNLKPKDDDTIADVYLKNLTTGALTLISESKTGAKGNGESTNPVLSDDGSTVAFQSSASNLHGNDGDRGADIFLRRLPSGNVRLLSVSTGGAKGNRPSYAPSLSADGSLLAFYSMATNLDPQDDDWLVADLYVKDTVDGALHLASTSNAGLKGTGNSVLPDLAGDGSRVAFHSYADNVHPDDDDDWPDIYVKVLDGA